MQDNAKIYTRYYIDELPDFMDVYFYGLRNGIYSVLDLGAGDGALLYALHKRGWLKDIKAVALDISAERIRRIPELNLGIEPVLSDATRTPFKDNKFDFIICHQVIEHVEDDNKLLQEIHRILKSNGICYLSTVFKKKLAWWYHRCNGKWTLDPTHLREYSNDELLNKLEKYFTIAVEGKTIYRWAITDFILARLGIMGYVYEKHKWLNWLRRFRIPIPNYYIWEMWLWKK